MNKNDLISILALSSIKGLGAAAIKKLWLIKHFTNKDPFASIGTGLEILKKENTGVIVDSAKEEAERIINLASQFDIKILSIADDKYPKKITEIKNPPPVLFFKGNLDLTEKTIGVIGTRDPNNTARIIAGRIGKYFSDNKFSIVNGLALGIDTQAIQINGDYHPNVIGVLAGGLNYNQTKTLLRTTAVEAEKVLDSGGLLLSECAPGIKEDTFSVVKSCRIQAAVSDAIILVQSNISGGSKYTLEAYCELERILAVVKPLESENDLPENEANLEIINNKEVGICKMTGVKLEKVRLKDLLLIKDKSDYPVIIKQLDLSYNKEINKIPGKLF